MHYPRSCRISTWEWKKSFSFFDDGPKIMVMDDNFVFVVSISISFVHDPF